MFFGLSETRLLVLPLVREAVRRSAQHFFRWANMSMHGVATAAAGLGFGSGVLVADSVLLSACSCDSECIHYLPSNGQELTLKNSADAFNSPHAMKEHCWL